MGEQEKLQQMLAQLNPQLGLQQQGGKPAGAVELVNLLTDQEKLVSENYALRLRLILIRRQELARQQKELENELLELNKSVTQWRVDVENKHNVDIIVDQNANAQFAMPRKKKVEPEPAADVIPFLPPGVTFEP